MPWLFALLAAFWLLLSGHYTPLLLALGILSVGLVAWLSHRMDIVDHEGQPVHLTFGMPRYFTWLTGQVLLTAARVARLVWSPRPALRPAVATVPSGDLSELEQVIYANSITLTPGTLSMSVDDAGIEVHGMVPADIEDLTAGGMHDQVQRLERN